MTNAVYFLDDSGSWLDRLKAKAGFLLADHKSLSGFHINVVSGSHAGVATAFNAEQYSVGSDPENDLILFADNLAAKHATFRPVGKLGNQLRIDAVDAPIGIGDRGTLRPGEWTTIKEATDLTFGNAVLSVSPIMDPQKVMRGTILIASIMILAFIISYIVATSWSQSTRSISALMNPSTPIETTNMVGNIMSPAEVAAARGLSQIRLGELGISHLVKIQNTDGSSLLAEGLMPESYKAKWNGFLQWYDGQTNYPSLINNVTLTGLEQDVPAIASVWLDGEPTVQFSNGSMGGIGSQVTGGWIIKAIYADRVELGRNGVVIAINLGGGV